VILLFMRNLSGLDRFLSASARLPIVLEGLQPVTGTRLNPEATSDSEPGISAANRDDNTLSDVDRALSGALMRVNHVGEVCAQALYEAQAIATKSPELRSQLQQAAAEERRHLQWVQGRLDGLGVRPSYLNPLWFSGAFGLGLIAGFFGDAISLGFVAETERQVESHLAGHMERLPASDIASREIVEKMRAEEAVHGKWALQAGGVELLWPVRLVMRLSAKLMTSVAHYI
jgi:3-demethoxyubiquinol 3-hydroxylase